MALNLDAYLSACQREIMQQLLPALPQDREDLREQAGMVATIIGRVHADLVVLPAVAGPRVAAYHALTEKIAAAGVRAAGGGDLAAVARNAAAQPPLQALEALRALIDEAIDRIEHLDGDLRSEILSEAIALDGEWRRACMAAMAEQAAKAVAVPGQHESGNLVTRERVTAYLQQKFPNRPGIAAIAVRRLAGGRSKDTYAIELSGAESWPSRVVMRQDAGRHALMTKVADEYVVVEGASAAGVRTARPLMLEAGDTTLGKPFYLMEFIEGEPSGNYYTGLFESDPAKRRQFACDLAQAMAELHAIDPASVFPDAPSHDQYLMNDIRHYKAQWRPSASEKSPMISAAFVWLEDEVKKGIGNAAIVHGDLAVHNLLVRDGRLAALLDWELYSVGDPAMDLAYVRPFVETAIAWPDFLAAYEAAGGAPIDERRLQMFEVWGNLRNGSIASGGGKAFLSDPTSKFEVAFMGAATGYIEQLLLPRLCPAPSGEK